MEVSGDLPNDKPNRRIHQRTMLRQAPRSGENGSLEAVLSELYANLDAKAEVLAPFLPSATEKLKQTNSDI